MSKKYDGSALMSGMAAGTEFLSQFYKRILANGGSPQLIHHMSLPASAEKLDELAKFAISQHFPVARSEIEKAAFDYAIKEFSNWEIAENDKRYCWGYAGLPENYGIPTIAMGEDYNGIPIPIEVREQIEGKPLPYPLVVTLDSQQYVVVMLCLSGDDPEEGIVPGEIDHVFLALAKYFDLEH